MDIDSCQTRVTHLEQDSYVMFTQEFIKIALNSMKNNWVTVDGETEYGHLLPNGSWSGMYGQFQRNEADVIFRYANPDSAALEVAYFSEPIVTDKVLFCMLKLQKITRPFGSAVFAPMALTLWIGIAMVLLCVTAIAHFLMKSQHIDLFSLLGSLSRQQIKVQDDHLKVRLFFGGWFGFTSFISFCYSAVLLSFLVNPTQPKQIDTFKELAQSVEQGKLVVYTRRDSKMPEFMRQSNEDHLMYLAEKIDANGWYIEVIPVSKYNSLRDERTVAWIYEEDFKLEEIKSRKWHLSKEVLYVVSCTVAIRKGFCGRERLSMIISRLNAAGLMNKIKSFGTFRFALIVSQKVIKQPMPLTFHDLSGSFVLVLVGYALSIIVLLVEVQWKIYKSRHIQITKRIKVTKR